MSERHHDRLWAVCRKLPSDYTPWGEVERWKDPNVPYEDCSVGCKWAYWLEDKDGQQIGMDWLVCGKPNAPRQGLLTFEHQAGFGCFEGEEDDDG